MGQNEANRHTLAVNEDLRIVFRRRFQRMAECVAEIEKRPVAGLDRKSVV